MFLPVKKVCVANGNSSASASANPDAIPTSSNPSAPVNSGVPSGLLIGLTPTDSDVVANGVVGEKFVFGSGGVHGLYSSPPEESSLTLYMRVGPGRKPVALERPTVMLVHRNVCKPELFGNLANGGVVLSGSPTSLHIAFKCVPKKGGDALVTLVFPPSLGSDDVEEHSGFRIVFLKHCPRPTDAPVGPGPEGPQGTDTHEESTDHDGGIPINGFSVGTRPLDTDVVNDGFSRRQYFGQISSDSPSIDENRFSKDHVTLFFSYHSDVMYSRPKFGDGDELAAATNGDYVEFQATGLCRT